MGSFVEAVAGTTRPATLRVEAGPVTWEMCDSAAYSSMFWGWQRAAHMLDASTLVRADRP